MTFETMLERIWIISQSPSAQDGFTVDLRTMRLVKSGMLAAYSQTQGLHGKSGLRKALRIALAQSKMIGGWYNYRDGLYYFDSSRVFRKWSRCKRFGWRHQQKCVVDLDKGRECWYKRV